MSTRKKTNVIDGVLIWFTLWFMFIVVSGPVVNTVTSSPEVIIRPQGEVEAPNYVTF